MLSDSNESFINLHVNYPIAFVIAGATVLAFLALEHIGREFYEHKGANTNGFTIIAFVMLSVHSLFAGAALGLCQHLATAFILVLAIITHKWAASFALATQITQSQLRKKIGVALLLIFSFMTPIGIYFGIMVSSMLAQDTLIEPTFSAIAAGTFLYLGTLHGLSLSFMIERCCILKNFSYVIFGFALRFCRNFWAKNVE